MTTMKEHDVMTARKERLNGRTADESGTTNDENSHCGIFEGSNQMYLYGRLSIALLR